MAKSTILLFQWFSIHKGSVRPELLADLTRCLGFFPLCRWTLHIFPVFPKKFTARRRTKVPPRPPGTAPRWRQNVAWRGGWVFSKGVVDLLGSHMLILYVNVCDYVVIDMVIIFHTCDMMITGLLHGYCMVITWLLHGYYMVILCLMMVNVGLTMGFHTLMGVAQ